MKHFLLNSRDQIVATFETFNPGTIKSSMKEYLSQFPNEELSHEKESTNKRYAGNDILDFYRLNKVGFVCKVVTKGSKEYLKPIE